MALYGIDISKWQSNETTDLGQDFVIVKATEGTSYVDPTCDPKYQRAKKAGKLLGFYHFARPDTGNSAEAEARFFYNNTKNYFREAVPVLDWEKSVQNVTWALAFLNEVYRLSGVRPMIYMSASVVTTYNWSAVAPYYGLWIAGYPSKYNVKNPPVPGPNELPYKIGAWKFAAMWQYTSSAGTLDRDIFYGDAKAWNAYAGKQTAQQEAEIKERVEETPAVPEPKDETIVTTTPSGEEVTVAPGKIEEAKDKGTTKDPVSTDVGLSIEEYNEIIDKLEKTNALISDTAKKYGVTLTMSNKVYDILKFLAQVIFPALATLYVGVAVIWGLPFGEEVEKTILLVVTFLNTVLGLTVAKASSDYNKK